MTLPLLRSCQLVSVIAAGVASVGCGGPARIYPPKVDAGAAGEAAVAEFDTDGDKLLSKEELKACPAIQDAMRRYDQDGDEQVSASEIEKRIGALSRNGLTGMYSLMFRVLQGGRPLANAKIELIPEDFLGGAVKPAEGTTNEEGLVRPSMEGVTSSTDGVALKGVQPGIYRLAITGPTDEITERYGNGEELGLEVGEHVLGSSIVFNLEAQ